MTPKRKHYACHDYCIQWTKQTAYINKLENVVCISPNNRQGKRMTLQYTLYISPYSEHL